MVGTSKNSATDPNREIKSLTALMPPMAPETPMPATGRVATQGVAHD